MQVPGSEYLIGIIAALASATLFAISTIVYKKFEGKITVPEIIATRVLVSLPLAFILILPPFNPDGLILSVEAAFILSSSMILAVFIGDGFYFMSQNRIGVSRAFPIAMSYPLLVYFLAALYLGEPVILSRVVGAILVVSGVSLIALDRRDVDVSMVKDRRIFLIGLGFAAITIIAWATSDLYLQIGLVGVDPLDANFVRVLVCSLFLIPVAPYSMKGGSGLTNRRTLAIAVLTGILGFGIPLLLMTYAVSYVGATVNSVIMAAAPLVSAPLAILYLKEEATLPVILGTFIAFLGVVLVILV